MHVLYKYKNTSTKMYHNIKLDLINSMDHMRISGTEPSSMILSQKSSFKVEKWCPKVPKQAKAKRDGVINQQNYNFNQLWQKSLMLSKR